MKAAIAKWIFAALLVLGLTADSRAEQLFCDVCGEPLGNQIFTGEDRLTGEPHKVCPSCANLEERCFLCGMPVKEGYRKLPDGRILCARDAKDAIESESDAKDICVDVRDDLDHLFSRFMTFPGNSVAFTIADKLHLHMNLPEAQLTNTCMSVFGTTASRLFTDGRYAHAVNILSHLRKSSLRAVCAHECAHTWLNENIGEQRRQTIDHDAVEGFCELVAYKYMENRGDESEMRIIRHNSYTKGQAAVLIEADKRFGFYAVLEWMKTGEDPRLDLVTLDRIRSVGGEARQAKSVEWVVPQSAPPPPAPDTLMLKGISGSVGHRFALINSTAFEPQQRAKVRVGQTNVSVVCLEIREQSVMIQVNGEKQELFLRSK